MGQEFIALQSLPSSLKMIGNNIMCLRYRKIRDVVNSELTKYYQDGIRIVFDVDDQDLLNVTFYNVNTKIGESIVIRTNRLDEIIKTINIEYSTRIIKKTRFMKKKNMKATSVSSMCKSNMDEIKFLANFVCDHYAGSGCYHEVEEFLDIPRIFNEKTNGAVVSIIMNDTNFTLVGVNNFTTNCSVIGVDQTTLCKQVIFILQAVIDYQLKFADLTGVCPVCNGSATEETVVKETERFGHENTNKAVEKFNKTVYDNATDLVGELNGKRPSSTGQTIRIFLSESFIGAGLKAKKLTGKYLVSLLTQDNSELLREVCSSAHCKVPSFLCDSSVNHKVRMRG